MRTFIVVLVFCIGCGGGVAIDDLDEALVDAFCDRYARCGVVESHDSCRELLDGFENIVELQHGVGNGSVRYDEDAMADCLDGFASASCDETSESSRVEPPVCDRAIRGTVADGGACMISAQCISQRCANTSCPMACCEGTCSPAIVEAPVGTACVPGTVNCIAGAFCNASRICQALLAADQPCSSNSQCGYGLYCANDTQRCAAAHNRGDACPDGDCADLGDTCDANQTCVAPARRGEPCMRTSGCQAPNLCNLVTLVCEPPPAIGQMCSGRCAPGAYCDTPTSLCAAEKPDDQPCTSGIECVSGNCDDVTGTCKPEEACL